jgi:hypothetical protein
MLDEAKWGQDDDLKSLREEFDKERKEFFRMQRQREEDDDLAKVELAATYDKIMRQKEAEAAHRLSESVQRCLTAERYVDFRC